MMSQNLLPAPVCCAESEDHISPDPVSHDHIHVPPHRPLLPNWNHRYCRKAAVSWSWDHNDRSDYRRLLQWTHRRSRPCAAPAGQQPPLSALMRSSRGNIWKMRFSHLPELPGTVSVLQAPADKSSQTCNIPLVQIHKIRS